MRDKKKLLALILFLLMGFFMFTFANPSDGIGTLTKPIEGEQEDVEEPEEPVINVDDNEGNNEPIIVDVNTAPVITVTPNLVKIILGEEYDVMTGVTVTDDRQPNLINSVRTTIASTDELEAGSYVVTYTVTDNGGNTVTATRTIIILEPTGDEDNDGYTNEEEKEAGTDFDDEDDKPDYQPNPTISFDNCPASMTVYGEVPNFGECVEVNDEFYGTDGVETTIDSNIDENNHGEYTVTVTSKDNLGNETTEEYTFEVTKREVTVTIDDKESTYLEALVELTSDAAVVAVEGTDIGVSLSSDVTETSEVGTYDITGTWTNENYDVTFVDGTYTINAKSLEDLTEEQLEDLLGVEYNDKTVTYDGNEHEVVIEGELPEGVTATYENNKGTNAGTYNGVATLVGTGNYAGEAELTATLTINPREVTKEELLEELNVTFEDKTVVYDGNEHSVVIEGELPEGVEVSYTNNKGTNVGTYDAVATFTGSGNYTGSASLEATLTINAKTLEDLTEEQLEDLLGVEYNDKTVTYDGNEHEVVITGTLPAGVTVSYKNNTGTNAGTYNGVATLVGTGNYAGEAELTAKLTINPREVTEEELLNNLNVKFEDKTVVYDGNEHSVVIEGELPEGVEVSYTNNKGTNVGTYDAVATFTGSGNYTGSASLEATLTINAKTLEDLTEEQLEELLGVEYNDKTVTYDGNEHEVVIEGELPEGVTATYENNKGTNAGTYNGVATLVGTGNYAGEAELTAKLTINPREVTEEELLNNLNVKFEDKTVTYDGKEHEIVISGTLPTGVTVSYTGNKGTEVGIYPATATFTGTGNYVGEATLSAFLTINKKSLEDLTEEDLEKLLNVEYNDKTVTYDGNEHEVVITGTLPTGVTVSYKNNKGTNVGTYNGVATVVGTGNYAGEAELTATLTIEAKSLENLTEEDLEKLLNVEYNDKTVTYDGNEHEVVITGTLPTGVTVSYKNNKGTNVGTYNGVATVVGTGNYAGEAELTATLTISAKSLEDLTEEDLEKLLNVEYNDKTVVYDGNEHSVVIEGELPEGVTVTYENNKGTNAGTYNGVATLVGTGNYAGEAELTAKLTINPRKVTEEELLNELKVTFEDKTVVYDGNEHSVVIEGELPEGVTVSYTNNKGTNVGVYDAVATFTGSGNYTGTASLEATLTINAKSLENLTEEDLEKLLNVKYNDKTVTYDGKEHEVVITGTLPEGVTVSYKNNKGTNVGTYNGVATVVGTGNYAGEAELTAKLTINPREVTEDELLNELNVTFKDKTVTYDGKEHEIVISGTLPTGVTVSYANNKGTNVGVYDAVATFTGSGNYAGEAELTATLTIEAKSLENLTEEDLEKLLNVKYNDKTVTYDGNEHSVVIEGELPEGVTVSYKNNKGTNVGTYNGVATVVGTGNYAGEAELTATLTIEAKSLENLTEEDLEKLLNVEYNDKTVTYDGNEHEVVITGTLPAGVTVSYKNNKGTNVGTYNGVATIVGTGNYAGEAELTATLTIEAKSLENLTEEDLEKLLNVEYNDKTVTYDGNEHEVVITGTLPAGVTVSYKNNKGTNVGTYNGVATIVGTGNYAGEAELTAKLTINAKTLEDLTEDQLEDLLGVEYNDKTVTYDGNEHEVVITGTLPAGVTVSYKNNKGTNVGTYNGVATIVGTGNYAGEAELTAKLTINAKTLEDLTEDQLEDLLGVEYNDKTVTYDGNEHEVVITGTLPAGVTVSYENNKGTNAGTYNGVATLVGTGNYAGEAELTAKLTINPREVTEEELLEELNVTFEDDEVTYDGNEHEIVISGTLPTGVTVSYENNKGTNVGTYDAVATFTGSGNYTGSASLEATLIITEKTLTEEDIAGFTFNGSTVTYNGEVHSLSVTGLPAGFEVSYENNNKKNVGTYTVVATITGTDNYSGTITKEATLVINKASVTVTADSKQSVFGEELKDLTYKVAGTVYGEDDLNIELSKEDGTAVGEYTISVTASNSNYDIKTINAVYTISPKTLVSADLANAKLEDKTVEYDGNAHNLEVTGLPEGFTATYSQKYLVDAGTYEITATITGNGNYSGQVTLTATLTINPKEVAVNWTNTTFEYDGNKHMPTASAEIEVVVNVKEGTDGISAGSHKAVATMKTENKNYKLTNTEVNYTITSKNISDLTEQEIKDVLGLSIADKSVTYNSEEQTLVVTGTIPSGVTVDYNDTNKATNAGTYPVVATITGTGNYEGTVTLEATLTINKAAISLKAEDKELTYGDTAKELTYAVTSGTIYGSDDLNITLTREDAENTNAGTYAITITASNSNYNITLTNGTYTIKKAIPSYTVPTGLTGEEDVTLSEIALPEGFTYQDSTTTPLAPGTHTVKVTYTPEDTTNYEVVTDIEVEVVVNATYYTIKFVDKDNNVISTQSIRKRGNAVEPTNIAEEYEEGGNIYVFSGWVGTYTNVMADATITPLYIEAEASTTHVYILGSEYIRPSNGDGYLSTDYEEALGGTEVTINLSGITAEQAEAMQNITWGQAVKVAVGEEEVMKYLAKSTKEQLAEISTGTDEGGSYTIEWYVLKYESDGWHLDGHKVYDVTTLDITVQSNSLSLTFNNSVTNLSVTIDGESKTVTNDNRPFLGLGTTKLGHEYTVSSIGSSQEERTVVVKYTVSGVEYTKTYSLVGTTLTEK